MKACLKCELFFSRPGSSPSLKKALRKIRNGEHDDFLCRSNCATNTMNYQCKLYKCPFIEKGNEVTKLLEQAKVSLPLTPITAKLPSIRGATQSTNADDGVLVKK